MASAAGATRSRCRSSCVSSRCCAVSAGTAGRRRSATRATFEIGGIPTRPFELEARSGQLFGKRGFATRRTVCQWGIGNFLQHVLGMAAGPAFVGINGHGETSSVKPVIIGAPPLFQGAHPKKSGLTRRPPACGGCHGCCEWLGAPKNPPACPSNWPVRPPIALETRHPLA